MARQILDLETLLRVPYVDESGFDLSPDGTQVAFSWNRSGQWEVYVAPLHGTGPPRQVTTGAGAKLAPRWSPDGRHLAYVLDLDGSERYDIWVYDQATGQHINLTPDTPDSIEPSYCWSPDGSQMAFISDRSGHFDTYVMPATGGPARAVLSLPHCDHEVYWSPDGRWLAVVTQTRGQDVGTFVVSPEGGQVRVISDQDDPLCAKNPCWSPDGARIAFASDRHGFFDIGLYELASGSITWLTRGAGDKERPAWSPDGSRLAWVFSLGPTTALNVLEVATGKLATYRVEPGVHYHPRFTPDGQHLLFLFDNPRHPPDLWLLSVADGSRRPVTRSLPPDLEDAPLIIPQEVRYPSLDGTSVPALLYRPLHLNEPAAAVVYVHGGPTWLAQVTWDPLVQHMVSRGWVVLAPNYRGSTGYGREWQLANRFDLGRGDTCDVVAGTDYLVREGIADPLRIAVTGSSYGGYLTMTSMTQYPDRWAAGSAVVPFLNWFTEHAHEREDLRQWDRENFGDPEKDQERFYERSPLFFLDRIAAPVQLICGGNDPRCPASESLQARDVLLAHGKTFDFVLYPDEGHGFLKTENVVDAKKRRVAFLARALEHGTAPLPQSAPA